MARREKAFQGFCKSHVPTKARIQAGLAANAKRARAASTLAHSLVSKGPRRRMRGKQQPPSACQRREACLCGTGVRARLADGRGLCQVCSRIALTGRTGHLAARVSLDRHSDEVVPRCGLNLHSGCRPVSYPRYAHNCGHCGANHFSEERVVHPLVQAF